MSEQSFIKQIKNCRDQNIVIEKVLDKNPIEPTALLELIIKKDECLSFFKENETYFIKNNMSIVVSHTIKRLNAEKALIESVGKDSKSKESFLNIIKNIEVRKEELSHWGEYLSATEVQSKYSYNIIYFVGLILFVSFIIAIIKKQVK